MVGNFTDNVICTQCNLLFLYKYLLILVLQIIPMFHTTKEHFLFKLFKLNYIIIDKLLGTVHDLIIVYHIKT